MSKTINLKIVTPEKVLIEKPIEALYSRAKDGEFGILPGHISYMTPLDIGVTRFIVNGETEFVSTIGGLLEVKDNEIVILSNAAELGEQIDLTRARAAKERAETRLGTAKGDVDASRAQIALAKAITRIKAASKSI